MTLVKWHVRRQEGKLCRMAVPKSHEVVVLLKLGLFECFLQAIEDDHPSENHKLLVHKGFICNQPLMLLDLCPLVPPSRSPPKGRLQHIKDTLQVSTKSILW